ncbi:alpha/beta hydrolase family protein [Amycolatopsis sp. cg5]|uniref:alpha/beta hydrolase family protein n=1 Tax=Amycolatopsis sp. cg5 TaxID=3238802 RepID=UPI00352506B5
MRKHVLAAVAGLLAIVTSTSVAEAAQTPYLPPPTGHFPVGSTSLHLTDTSRSDPWVPARSRELMVTLWYPALPSGGRRAQYMTPRESELFLTDAGITGLPLDLLSKTRTNAIGGAKPLGGKHSMPLIVLSPGYTKPRATLSSLAEDLASRGYVVAGIGHTYENAATEFPDGRVVTCASCEVLHDEAFWAKLDAGRAADTSFVLDELTGPHAKWPSADPARIAMAGHSAGGSAALTTMVADPRVRAGIDIDGTTNTPVPDGGLARPFLFLGRASQYTPGLPSPVITWERDWRHLTGWKRWLVVDGPVHASFTDVGLLGEQLGLDFGAKLPAARTSEITRAYVGAFFDLHLRHEREPLLDKPSRRYPEVAFCAPA